MYCTNYRLTVREQHCHEMYACTRMRRYSLIVYYCMHIIFHVIFFNLTIFLYHHSTALRQLLLSPPTCYYYSISRYTVNSLLVFLYRTFYRTFHVCKDWHSDEWFQLNCDSVGTACFRFNSNIAHRNTKIGSTIFTNDVSNVTRTVPTAWTCSSLFLCLH